MDRSKAEALAAAARASIADAETHLQGLRERLAKAERAIGQPAAAAPRAGLRVVRGERFEDLRKVRA